MSEDLKNYSTLIKDEALKSIRDEALKSIRVERARVLEDTEHQKEKLEILDEMIKVTEYYRETIEKPDHDPRTIDIISSYLEQLRLRYEEYPMESLKKQKEKSLAELEAMRAKALNSNHKRRDDWLGIIGALDQVMPIYFEMKEVLGEKHRYVWLADTSVRYMYVVLDDLGFDDE